jgi:flagellar hook protein FlgE
VGDNISNSSTVGYKASRAEFEDLIAGGQTAGKVIGSGSATSAVSTIMEQGTLEFTGRTLDLAIDGNGFFVVADGSERYYSRAGNFKVDSAGYIVNQNDLAVLGFPDGGSGALEPLNVNSISQGSIATTTVSIAGNVDASSPTVPVASIPAVTAAGAAPGTTTTYADLNDVSEFSTVVEVFDSLGEAHTVTFFYFHTDANQYTVRGYVNSEEVDPSGTATGLPRQIGTLTMTFDGNGQRVGAPPVGTDDFTSAIAWNNGSTASSIGIRMVPFTQYSASSNILSITQDGQGVGSVATLNIETNGDIFAILTNGQTAVIGKIGLANFANPEGLVRLGNQLLQQSPASGEPIAGSPDSGIFGKIQSGSVELSTVDIATEFVRMITLQRGFQANSRIITTINQLLNEIIQLA